MIGEHEPQFSKRTEFAIVIWAVLVLTLYSLQYFEATQWKYITENLRMLFSWL